MKPNLRRCLSCQKVDLKQEFWRVVRVDSAVKLDVGMGRSAYICPNLNCLQLAQKKNRLGRSLRTQINPEIYEILKQRLSNA
ncbi:putative nucleic-acid-binding protein implicated in transcription termination [Synechococcus sp. PCC 7502]|uniref:YlxR family protein n=1 Tax=Synechococcus sp. PCC 7502 TaxID=1173263 RepID=UPI00029FFE37|nr:YlxR family protein [Synechococcus sp. PCC 7502]AFY74328.1 putative nucleic-acid-binding protein implicated in transcription termination [Synechococcus sp. PCC 7502]